MLQKIWAEPPELDRAALKQAASPAKQLPRQSQRGFAVEPKLKRRRGFGPRLQRRYLILKILFVVKKLEAIRGPPQSAARPARSQASAPGMAEAVATDSTR